MYERLIQKLINRNVGAIGGTLTPTGGTTSCTIESGSFSNTYDGYDTTYCCFKTYMSCLSEWYWDTPVNVTGFNILSLFYGVDSYIYGIWGRVNGSWVQVWSGTWHPTHGYWASKAISCDECTGIRIAQMHDIQPSDPCILEVSIDYDVIPEGKATIVQILMPDYFVPGVEFDIRPKMRNDGGEDIFFVRLTDRDTGSILKEVTRSTTLPPGGVWTSPMYITLTQTTDFHGRIEFGHLEGATKVVDDSEDFTIPVFTQEGEANIISVDKPSSFTPNVSFHIKPKVRNDGGSDTLFLGLYDTDTGATLKHPSSYTHYTGAGALWTQDWIVVLSQTTDFHGRVDAGHIE